MKGSLALGKGLGACPAQRFVRLIASGCKVIYVGTKLQRDCV